MQGEGYSDYLDFYQRGPYAPFLREQRLAGSVPVRLFSAGGPASSFDEPPIPDITVQVLKRGAFTARVDQGAGVWRGHVRSGDVIVTPANSGLSTDMGASEMLIAAVPWMALRDTLTEACGREIADFGLLHAAPFRDGWIEALCHRMWAEAELGHPLGSLFCDSAVVALGAALLHKAEIGFAPPPVRKGGLAPYRIRRVLALIHDRLGEDLGLEELAAAAGLSPSHFARSFRAETGETPWRYLLSRRVERARELLAGTELTLVEVAKACGFADQSHLGTWFKRLTGATPKQYRQDRRN